MRACVGDLHNATPHSFKTSNQQRRPLKSQKAKPRIRKSNLSRCNTLKNSVSSGSLDIKIKMRVSIVWSIYEKQETFFHCTTGIYELSSK